MLENRQRQLASLQRMEEKIRKSGRATSSNNNSGGNSPQPRQTSSSSTSCPHHKMTTFILDISTSVSDNFVTWLPVTPIVSSEAPQESILYRCGVHLYIFSSVVLLLLAAVWSRGGRNSSCSEVFRKMSPQPTLAELSQTTRSPSLIVCIISTHHR